jgi:hypothetical protein
MTNSTQFVYKKMFIPFDETVIVRVDKRYIKDAEGKPVVADDGTQIYEPQQECTVIASNIEGIRKGMKVIPLLRGGLPINSEDNKKFSVVIIDRRDIKAIKK